MMNKINYNIFEYETLDWKKFKNLSFVKKSLQLYEKKSNFQPFKYTASGIKARQYVGVISLAGESIQVLPKIFDKNNNKDQNIKGLLYLLKLTKKLDIKETDLANLSKHNDLLEIFIYLFANNLLELLHNDFHRNYVNQEDNLNYVKGKINFTKNIRYNLVNQAKIYCEYDEFEENILLNQIFKATVTKCIQFSKNNFNLLQKCDILLSNVADIRFNNPSICDQVKFNRLNQKYQYIFELAKLLLFGNSPSIDNKNLQTFSIMFDMNKLFEEAIFEIINTHKTKFNTSEVKAQKSNQYVFDNPKLFQLQPDIYLKQNDHSVIIIDTKYKKIDGVKPKDEKTKFGVSQSDVYQIFAYSKYYKAKKCILLYPQYSENINKKDLNSSNTGFNLSVNTINLFLEDSKTSYSNYIDKIHDQLLDIIKQPSA